MAKIVWTEPALFDLEAIADYIMLDKPTAADKLVKKIVDAVERLTTFPNMGRIPPEIQDHAYRELVVPPCRVFYRINGALLYIVWIMRSEQRFDIKTLEGRMRN